VSSDRLVVRNSSVYEYPDEIPVELTARDRSGDLVVVSSQFDYLARVNDVEPKRPVDETVRWLVSSALDEKGYTWSPPKGE